MREDDKLLLMEVWKFMDKETNSHTQHTFSWLASGFGNKLYREYTYLCIDETNSRSCEAISVPTVLQMPLLLHTIGQVLYAQTTLFITSDEGGFVSSIIPAVDASRNVTAGSEIKFEVNMSATPASAVRGGHIMLCFQGHQVGRHPMKD